MLKIKADRMKDLEKFGFDSYLEYKIFGGNAYFWIDETSGIIYLHFEESNVDEDSTNLNFLYDLIKADMVEKVEEINNG